MSHLRLSYNTHNHYTTFTTIILTTITSYLQLSYNTHNRHTTPTTIIPYPYFILDPKLSHHIHNQYYTHNHCNHIMLTLYRRLCIHYLTNTSSHKKYNYKSTKCYTLLPSCSVTMFQIMSTLLENKKMEQTHITNLFIKSPSNH